MVKVGDSTLEFESRHQIHYFTLNLFNKEFEAEDGPFKKVSSPCLPTDVLDHTLGTFLVLSYLFITST